LEVRQTLAAVGKKSGQPRVSRCENKTRFRHGSTNAGGGSRGTCTHFVEKKEKALVAQERAWAARAGNWHNLGEPQRALSPPISSVRHGRGLSRSDSAAFFFKPCAQCFFCSSEKEESQRGHGLGMGNHIAHAQPILASRTICWRMPNFSLRDINAAFGRMQRQRPTHVQWRCHGAPAATSFADVIATLSAREKLGFPRITAKQSRCTVRKATEIFGARRFILLQLSWHSHGNLSRWPKNFVIFGAQEFSYRHLPDEFPPAHRPQSSCHRKKKEKKKPPIPRCIGGTQSAARDLVRASPGPLISGCSPRRWEGPLARPGLSGAICRKDKGKRSSRQDQGFGADMLAVATGAVRCLEIYNAQRTFALPRRTPRALCNGPPPPYYRSQKVVPFRQAHDSWSSGKGTCAGGRAPREKPWTQASLEDVQEGCSALSRKGFLGRSVVETVIANKGTVPGGTGRPNLRPLPPFAILQKSF